MPKRRYVLPLVLVLGALGTLAFMQLSGPPLLRGATVARGSLSNVCGSPISGPIDAYEEQAQHSPEMRARLRRDFPSGTPETLLIAELKRQGFDVWRCHQAPSIGMAHVWRKSLLLGEAQAQVMWKADAGGRIVWTDGSIQHIFL